MTDGELVDAARAAVAITLERLPVESSDQLASVLKGAVFGVMDAANSVYGGKTIKTQWPPGSEPKSHDMMVIFVDQLRRHATEE